jgi:hypothetical protein
MRSGVEHRGFRVTSGYEAAQFLDIGSGRYDAQGSDWCFDNWLL